jgi:hypothetical protein
MDIDDIKPEQVLIDTVVAAMKESDTALDLTLSAPIQTSVVMQNGSYRTKSLIGNETFTFHGLREGKRSSYIFEFEPVDARDYKMVEFDEDKVFQAFPGLEEVLVAALDQDSGMAWRQASAKFRTNLRRERSKAMKVAEKQAAAEAESHYENDDLWGSF